MKPLLFLVPILAIGTSLFADDPPDEFSDPATIPCGNGNILLTNVGNYSVTPCTWIRLSTNSNYMVACQIAYGTVSAEGLPSAPAEIMEMRKAERCLNLALLKFLQKTCEGKTDAELVRRYRSGFIRAKVEDDFPTWFDNVKATLMAFHDTTAIDSVVVWKVSMRAVGPFAESLDAL